MKTIIKITLTIILCTLSISVHFAQAQSGDYTLSSDDLNAEAWQQAIERSESLPPLTSGNGKMSLIRIILEDAHPDDVIQVTARKIALPYANYDSGGVFKEIKSGEFVLIDHLSATTGGTEEVTIGTFQHHRVTPQVTVPAAGVLNIVGDIIIPRASVDMLGRIAVTIENDSGESLIMNEFRFGPDIVGGPYGRTIALNQATGQTDLVTAGRQKTLLPDFNMVESRWEVQVLGGMETRLTFVAHSQTEVELVEEIHVPLEDEAIDPPPVATAEPTATTAPQATATIAPEPESTEEVAIVQVAEDLLVPASGGILSADSAASSLIMPIILLLFLIGAGVYGFVKMKSTQR